jgi:hypothetical protein
MDKIREARVEKKRKAKKQVRKATAKRKIEDARFDIVESSVSEESSAKSDSSDNTSDSSSDNDNSGLFEFQEPEMCKNCRRSGVPLIVVNKKDM